MTHSGGLGKFFSPFPSSAMGDIAKSQPDPNVSRHLGGIVFANGRRFAPAVCLIWSCLVSLLATLGKTGYCYTSSQNMTSPGLAEAP